MYEDALSQGYHLHDPLYIRSSTGGSVVPSGLEAVWYQYTSRAGLGLRAVVPQGSGLGLQTLWYHQGWWLCGTIIHQGQGWVCGEYQGKVLDSRHVNLYCFCSLSIYTLLSICITSLFSVMECCVWPPVSAAFLLYLALHCSVNRLRSGAVGSPRPSASV